MPKGVFVRTEEHKKNIGLALKGKKHSEETKAYLSKIRKGKPNGRLGKFCSEETKEAKNKMRDAHKGEKHPNWQGGKSFEPYTVDWTATLRRSIRERDNYTCRICEAPQEDKAHHVHHIDYKKNNNNPNNLITLCFKCHAHTNHNRAFWQIKLNQET